MKQLVRIKNGFSSMRWLRCKNITPKNRINLDFPLCVCSGLTHTHTHIVFNECASVKGSCVCVTGSCMKKHYMCYKHDALVTVNIRLFAFFSLNVRLLFDIDNFFVYSFQFSGFFVSPFVRFVNLYGLWFPHLSTFRCSITVVCHNTRATYVYIVHVNVFPFGRFGIWVVQIRNTIQFPYVLVVCSESEEKMCWDFSLQYNLVGGIVTIAKRINRFGHKITASYSRTFEGF